MLLLILIRFTLFVILKKTQNGKCIDGKKIVEMVIIRMWFLDPLLSEVFMRYMCKYLFIFK